MAAEKSVVPVTIQGREYRIRSEGDGELVHEAAEMVDGIMEKLRGRSGAPVDSLDVAVLAALNLAKQIIKRRGPQSLTDVNIDGEVDQLKELVELVEGMLPDHMLSPH